MSNVGIGNSESGVRDNLNDDSWQNCHNNNFNFKINNFIKNLKNIVINCIDP